MDIWIKIYNKGINYIKEVLKQKIILLGFIQDFTDTETIYSKIIGYILFYFSLRVLHANTLKNAWLVKKLHTSTGET